VTPFSDNKSYDQNRDDDDDEEPNTPRTQENPVFPANPPISIDGMPANTLAAAVRPNPETNNPGPYNAQIMKPKFTRAPIKEPGRVAYLGESSNLSLLVHDRGFTDVVHYPLPETIRGSRGQMTELDSLEIEILHRRGAFLLPPRELCDELVEAYFKWVAPVVPIINRNRFMRRYQDPQNPPSLLLLQAILLAGSRVCNNSKLMDQNGSTIPASTTFYKRAKALYDANYEDDRVTLVQALVLMGWYWEGPEGRFLWHHGCSIVLVVDQTDKYSRCHKERLLLESSRNFSGSGFRYAPKVSKTSTCMYDQRVDSV
jgi:hypothetical protein